MPRHRAAWNSGHSARILQHRAFPCRSIAGEGGMWWSVAWAGAVTLSRVRGGPSVWQCCLPPPPARTYPGTAVPEKRTHPAPPPRRVGISPAVMSKSIPMMSQAVAMEIA